MYKLMDKPYHRAKLENGSVVVPLATLADDNGGVSHIIEDDHCYVLINQMDNGCRMVAHWYPEAVYAMRTLPIPEQG